MEMSVFLRELIEEKFSIYFLLLGVVILLWNGKPLARVRMRYMWLTVVTTAILPVFEVLESISVGVPSLLKASTVYSILCYCLRTAVAMFLVMTVLRDRRARLVSFIPQLVNMAVMACAMFSDKVFAYLVEDGEVVFHRGPLGIVVFVVAGLYMLEFLGVLLMEYHRGRRNEVNAIIFCAMGFVISTAIDVVGGGDRSTLAIPVSMMFYYIFISYKTTSTDVMTGLLNRQAFFDDSAHLLGKVSALVMVDMNGLKRLNDTSGHAAGDRAIRVIGEALSEGSGADSTAYRIGGDEFIVLFFNRGEEYVRSMIERMKERTEAQSVSISCGLAMKAPGDDIDSLMRSADKDMYTSKSAYYAESGMDRRR